MLISKSTQLVKSLLECCDISSHQLEEENKVLLSIDYELNILIVIENSLIHLISAVGVLSPNEMLYRNLLNENSKGIEYTNPRYSIDSDNDELIVSISVDGNSIELERFIEITENFIDLCEKWTRILAAGGMSIPTNALSGDENSSGKESSVLLMERV